MFKSLMDYFISSNNKKINTLLSIFTISALILAPLGISSSAFSQSPPFIMVAITLQIKE